MENSGSNKSSNFSVNKMPFWKKNSKNVPGNASPSIESWSCGGTSFLDFQDSVRDAWETEDGQTGFSVKISKELAHATALNVINSHRRIGSFSLPLKLASLQAQPGVHLPNLGKSLPSSSITKPSETTNNSDPKQIVEPKSSKPIMVANDLERESEMVKAEKIKSLLEGPSSTDLKLLQSLSYSGLPASVRGTAWKLLAGYLPANIERREAVLQRKREEYWKYVEQYYHSKEEKAHEDTYHQIHIDIPRMSPSIGLFQQQPVQQMFERMLFIWAIRHPASGYVQGMNDLATPFFIVFLEELLPQRVPVESFELEGLKKEVKDNLEADTFWCMSKFLDSIQVNYIFAQTGIQEKVKKLQELIERVDAPLHHHLQRNEVDYLQFSFRWMNNLLVRELPLRSTIRLWDTYLQPFGTGWMWFCAVVCVCRFPTALARTANSSRGLSRFNTFPFKPAHSKLAEFGNQSNCSGSL